MDAPLSNERFIANLALGIEHPGPGVKVATVGPSRGRRVEMLTTPHGVVPRNGALVLEDAEANAWQGYRLELFGTELSSLGHPAPPPGVPTITLYDDVADASLTLLLWRQWARYENSPLRAELLWLPTGFAGYSIRVLEPDATYSRKAAEAAFQGLTLLRGRSLLPALERVKPGPKPGTGAKVSSQSEWHQRIRDRVLTKQTRATAEDWIIAQWLGVSTSLLYQLMRKWGPKTLGDLREGKF